MTSPARFLLFVILVIAGIKGSEQLYSFVAYRDERAAVRTLRTDLVHTGTELMAVRARRQALYADIKGRDQELERELRRMQAILRANGRTISDAAAYDRYNHERIRYNLHIEERNARYREWQDLDERHSTLVDRYDLLADSIHGIAVRMGEPYYQVPTALEAAQERTVEP